MAKMKTPGVYIVEKNAFPNSVVEVATAVPAFIGYTQTNLRHNKSVKGIPTRITSMAEYQAIFGFDCVAEFDLIDTADAKSADVSIAQTHYGLIRKTAAYRLYQSIQLFYANGGGPCYIVSIGSYLDPIANTHMLDAMQSLVKEQEPSLLVIPEAVSLPAAECQVVQQQMMAHCSNKQMRNRFAILDVHDGFQNTSTPSSVENFRKLPNIPGGDFAAVYYPWLNTSLLGDSDVRYTNLSVGGRKILQSIIQGELTGCDSEVANIISEITGSIGEKTTQSDSTKAKYTPEIIDQTLRAISPNYLIILNSIKRKLNLLPPSSAMAGLYAMVDNTKGVWKAPANISIACVVSPAFEISEQEQQNLNVDLNGKSINAIRFFVGEGTLVWGARTLDGNSLDWRYINVRRTMIMLEQSLKLAVKAYVFEPNEAQTWVTIKSMMSNFLTSIWKRGGLAGAVPADAFSVYVGLGETMTGEDILEGTLRIRVLVAITRPAEFIEITFQQQMQKS